MVNKRLISAATALGLLMGLGSVNGASAKVTVSFWQLWGASGAYVDYLKGAVQKFNATHKNIEVKMSFAYPMDEKMLAAIAGGTGPDVAAFDRFMLAQWGTIDAFTPLTPYIRSSNLNSSQFIKSCWNESMVNGVLYGIPLGTDTRLMYYNKTLFQKRGLNPSAPPKTWREMDEIVMKLTKRNGNNTLESVGFIPYQEQGSPYTWFFLNDAKFFSADGKKLTINNKNSVDALEWEASLVERQGGYDTVNKLINLGAFGKGSIGMVVNGDWYVHDVDKQSKGQDIGVAALPYNKEKVSWSGGHALVIPKLSKKKDAAWEFIKYASSKEAQLDGAKAAYAVPANRSAVQELIKTPGLDPRWSFALNQLDDSIFRPQSPIAYDLWKEVLDTYMPVIQRKTSAQAMLDSVVRKMQPRLDRALSRKKK